MVAHLMVAPLDGGTLDGGTLYGGTLDGGTLDGSTLNGGTPGACVPASLPGLVGSAMGCKAQLQRVSQCTVDVHGMHVSLWAS